NGSKEFLLQVHAGTAEGRTDVQSQDMAGNDSAGPSIIPGDETPTFCGVPAGHANVAAMDARRCEQRLYKLLFIDFTVLHHELDILQQTNIRQRVAGHGDDVG